MGFENLPNLDLSAAWELALALTSLRLSKLTGFSSSGVCCSRFVLVVSVLIGTLPA